MSTAPAPSTRALPDGYELLVKGMKYDVVIKSKTLRDLKKKVPADKAADLENLLKLYSGGGPAAMPQGKFNSREGWFPSDKNKKAKLEAFKPYQMRAYGFCRSFNGKPTFFITGLDRSKKQDRADQVILNAAGNEAARIADLLE